MKKFLTVFVAVVLVTSMSIIMVGCDPKTMTISTIANQVDLTQGLVIRADATLSVNGDESDISIVAKAKNENKQPTVDVEMTTTNDGKNSYERYYIRNDDLFVSQKNAEDIANEEFKKTKIDDSEQGSTALMVIEAIINSDAKELTPLLDSFVEFSKDGKNFQGTLDIKQDTLELFDKLNSVIFGDANNAGITENTTIGELSQSLELHEKLTEIFGDMTIDKIYSIVKPILTDCGVTGLPENGEAIITLIKTNLQKKGISLEIPELGDKTVVGYFDALIEQNKDKKLGDLIGGSQTDFNFLSMLPLAKKLLPLEDIRKALEKCTATVTILTDSKGKILSLDAEVKIHSELMANIEKVMGIISGYIGGNTLITFARPIATSDYIYECSAQATVEYAATDFKDASTFKIAQ